MVRAAGGLSWRSVQRLLALFRSADCSVEIAEGFWLVISVIFGVKMQVMEAQACESHTAESIHILFWFKLNFSRVLCVCLVAVIDPNMPGHRR